MGVLDVLQSVAFQEMERSMSHYNSYNIKVMYYQSDFDKFCTMYVQNVILTVYGNNIFTKQKRMKPDTYICGCRDDGKHYF